MIIATRYEIFMVDRRGGSMSLPMPQDDYLETLREFIDFVNRQVGVYTDALAGFAGNKARIEFQVARVLRKSGYRKDGDGTPVTVWSSLEDPKSPDVIHNRIIRSDEFLANNSVQGFNEQQHTRAIIVFLFAYWDEEIRPRLARQKSLASPNLIRVDALGDLRILRKAIIHNKSFLSGAEHARLRVMGEILSPDAEICISHDHMHKIFVYIKQGIARLILEHTGPRPAAPEPSDIVDVAIQRK